MPWLESHQELERHPKTLRLMELSGLSLEHVLGVLHRFWWWCLDYAEDGDLEKYGISLLSKTLGIDANKLVEAGWIDKKPYLRVHNWWRYIWRFLGVKYKNYPEKYKEVQRRYLEKSQGGSKKTRKGTPKGSCKTAIPNQTIPNLKKQRSKSKVGKIKSNRLTNIDGFDHNLREKFSSFWSAYPKKKARGAAEKAFGRINPNEEFFRIIMEAIKHQSTCEDWKKENGKFIPYPATWLNQKRWEDEVSVTNNGGDDRWEAKEILEIEKKIQSSKKSEVR